MFVPYKTDAIRRTLALASARSWLRAAAVFIAMSAAVPAISQDRPNDDEEQLASPGPVPAPMASRPNAAGLGRVADSAAGRAGQRRTRYQDPAAAAVMRISSRIANRVQSRIGNRIDPNYSPTANATSPFETASERTRTPGRRR
jgi:hypothetical protein